LNLEIGSGKNWFNLNNTGITRIDIAENAYNSTELKYANRLAHLALGQVS
jgi:hypothetical protein